MKTSTKAMAGLALAVSLAAAHAHADLFKCVKDGKTSYQSEPCGVQGGNETKLQSAKPSAWAGCYVSIGRGWESGTRKENYEVRQDGDTLYIPVGMEGKEETRLIMKPASSDDLAGFNQRVMGMAGQATSGLAVYGTAVGERQKIADADNGVRLGLYWIRAEGKESLRAFFPFAVDETKKVPCPAKR